MTTRKLAATRPCAVLPSCADLLAGRADDVVLPISAWAAILPGRRRGRGMHARALLKWHVVGCLGHKLPTRRVGARHVVDGFTLRTFLERIQPAAVSSAPTPHAIARRRAHRAKAARIAAERALRRGRRP